jgi:hypothetical protein
MSVNSITRTAAIANETKGYADFIEGMKKMPVNISTTVDAILREQWSDFSKSDRIKLGKAIMSNIKNGNIVGIIAEEFVPGKAQSYKRVSDIEVRTIFSAPLWASVDSMTDVFRMNSNLSSNWMYVKCFWFENNVFICQFLDHTGKKIVEYNREIPASFFEKNGDTGTNEEFKAIVSLWYGLDRAYENIDMIKSYNVDSLCFLAPNEQMMNRIAARKFDTIGNIYKYTDFIQKQFADFKENGIRELPFKYGIYAMLNSELRK